MSAQKGRMGPTKVGDLFPFTTLAKHGLARTSWHERSSSIQTLLCIQCRSFTMSDTPSLKRTRKVSPSLHDIQSSSEQAESPAHTAGFPEMLSTNSTKGLIAFLLYNHDVRQLVLDCLNVYDFAMLATQTVESGRLCSKSTLIFRSLRRFVDNPMAFRFLLRKTSALVGGSFPLGIFEGRTWRGGTLDV